MDLLVERDENKPNFGDMVFVNGACPITADFTDSVSQKVFIMLRTFQNEWFLNETTGVPYIQEILGKKIGKNTVDRIIQQKILAEEGVASIESYTSFLGGDRVYKASVRIKTTEGEIFTDTLNLAI